MQHLFNVKTRGTYSNHYTWSSYELLLNDFQEAVLFMLSPQQRGKLYVNIKVMVKLPLCSHESIPGE
jgi:hypothetical protein